MVLQACPIPRAAILVIGKLKTCTAVVALEAVFECLETGETVILPVTALGTCSSNIEVPIPSTEMLVSGLNYVIGVSKVSATQQSIRSVEEVVVGAVTGTWFSFKVQPVWDKTTGEEKIYAKTPLAVCGQCASVDFTMKVLDVDGVIIPDGGSWNVGDTFLYFEALGVETGHAVSWQVNGNEFSTETAFQWEVVEGAIGLIPNFKFLIELTVYNSAGVCRVVKRFNKV